MHAGKDQVQQECGAEWLPQMHLHKCARTHRVLGLLRLRLWLLPREVHLAALRLLRRRLRLRLLLLLLLLSLLGSLGSLGSLRQCRCRSALEVIRACKECQGWKGMAQHAHQAHTPQADHTMSNSVFGAVWKLTAQSSWAS